MTVKVRVSQKRQSQPLCHKPAVNPRDAKDNDCTPRVTEDDGHITCHNDDGIHHVSQKTTILSHTYTNLVYFGL